MRHYINDTNATFDGTNMLLDTRVKDYRYDVDNERVGMQRYRNAYLAHMQLAPHVVSGQEWRAIVANFAEFFGRSATDWEKPTDEMKVKLQSKEGLRPEERWQRRHLQACVFCARSHWVEELHSEFLAGKDCFMNNPDAVWELLDVEDYHKRWPKIPLEELESSAVIVAASGTAQENGKTEYKVLLHTRRVSPEQAAGRASVYVCSECKWAFGGPRPFLCKYALANDMWLGRWDPLFRDADKCPLSHQMLLALARVVSTKIVLRPDGSKNKSSDSTANWDFLFHQSGIVGTAERGLPLGASAFPVAEDQRLLRRQLCRRHRGWGPARAGQEVRVQDCQAQGRPP